MLPVTLFAQNKLSGVVTDKANGQTMPGVNVAVKGTNNGVATDFSGANFVTHRCHAISPPADDMPKIIAPIVNPKKVSLEKKVKIPSKNPKFNYVTILEELAFS